MPEESPQRIILRVLRYNPDTDDRPRFHDFPVDAAPHATILDLLHAVKDAQDGSLTFSRSCRGGMCGSCGLRVNGAGKLACLAQAAPEVREGVIRLEPLTNLRAVKDLVVDFGPFFEHLDAVTPWLVPRAPGQPSELSRLRPEQLRRVGGAQNCILCGLCFSSCTAVTHEPAFLGPHAYAKAWRFLADPRDGAGSARLFALNATVWSCSAQLHCADDCPTGVDPAARIADARHALWRARATRAAPQAPKPSSTLGLRNTAYFYRSLKRYGKLDLRGYPARLGGLKGLALGLGTAFKLWAKGRNPPAAMPRVKGWRDVAKLMKAIDAYEAARAKEEAPHG